jgi:hypothetical protein
VADPRYEDGSVDYGEDYSAVADAVLPEACEAPLEDREGISQAGESFGDPVQDAAGIRRVEFLQVLDALKAIS